jgi:hypothetical protein
MANTDITLSPQGFLGIWEPNISRISVSEGDTFTIASSGGFVNIFFSPALSSILLPEPQFPVSLGDGQDVSFTFTSSAIGSYSIVYGVEEVLETDFLLEEGLVVVLSPNLPLPTSGGVISGPNATPEGNR